MPEYSRFKQESEKRSVNSHRKTSIRTKRRAWLKKQKNFTIADSPLDNRV